jgi:uncharacterized membrane protein YfcA|tara:strand:- start:1724 stop:2461 length:738 start_codon:yes stop_codon:yes gene_type:complete
MLISDPSIYLLILLVGAFTAALVQGATGFGSGLVLNAFWLHILEPSIAIPLNIFTCLLISGAPIYKLRKTLDFSKLKPFIIFGVIGIPFGMLLLTITDPRIFKASIGIFLVLYALLMLISSNFSIKVNTDKSIDSFIGLISGLMGGFAALGGLLPTIWVGLQKLPKNTQRGTYEPFIFITSIVAVISFAVAGLYTIQMAYDLLKILPALIIGSWLGVKIYHVLDGEVFRRTILGLILAAGIVLLI